MGQRKAEKIPHRLELIGAAAIDRRQPRGGHGHQLRFGAAATAASSALAGPAPRFGEQGHWC